MRVGEYSAEWGTCGGGGSGGDRGHAEAKIDTGGLTQVDMPANPQGESVQQESRMTRLLRTIEGEIVPRLVLARRSSQATATPDAGQGGRPDAADVTELVRLLLAHDVGVASAYVESIRQWGASFESVCLSLLAPAARELGLLWEADECDFMQVTVGLCRLHQLLRELSPAFRVDSVEPKTERNILLTPVPGDQHTFGITLVAQFLRKAGWQVWSEFAGSSEELLELVRTHWFVAVGLSLGSETRVDDLARVIQAVRHASRNRSVGILVGGPLLVARPELADSIGADATAMDGPMAVLRAEHMIESQRGKLKSAGMDGLLFEKEGI
jgi:methanogenic corrinoid protein MtbC1